MVPGTLAKSVVAAAKVSKLPLSLETCCPHSGYLGSHTLCLHGVDPEEAGGTVALLEGNRLFPGGHVGVNGGAVTGSQRDVRMDQGRRRAGGRLRSAAPAQFLIILATQGGGQWFFL